MGDCAFGPGSVFCRQCKKQIAENHDFCPFCGAGQRMPRISGTAKKPHQTQGNMKPPVQTNNPPKPVPSPVPVPVPDVFGIVDYRFVVCPKCGKAVLRPRRGNPPGTTCRQCGTHFLVDVRGRIPVVCPACQSTAVSGGSIPYWMLAFGFAGAMLIDMQPTRYQCRSCGCHFMGSQGANVAFGFFISG